MTKADESKAAGWRACRSLAGFDALRRSFAVEDAILGYVNSFPESLHVDLVTNNGLINSVWWWDPIRESLPQYDWYSFLESYDEAEAVIGKHTWLAEWRDVSPGRQVELHAFGLQLGETDYELKNFILPVWQAAGLRGEPAFSVLARFGDNRWAQLYFGKDEPRALITSVSRPDANTGHWLDGLQVFFHPRCTQGEKSERYVVVDPSGNWEVRKFPGCRVGKSSSTVDLPWLQ